VDLVCTRYPGTKPSEYLDIQDRYTAFQLDVAVALKGKDRDNETNNNYLEYIKEHIVLVARCLGYKPPAKKKQIIPKKDLTVNEALKMLGGAGVVYKKG
jgi:hypothetical protein